ncbi:hypothetical protein ACH0AH_06630 [Microbacterium paludicola]|uniref:Uncharacterized protein n=1 Tax=Microbacterium paludicola TaxID=300019 RepID=A0A4Y9FV10_9MICO|nr:hypothetical protein [Microbacterium paludicola]MBF0816518.1 hypothetical protein [Microbacterium paludicola]TFU32824.1 hypothetical protein E4U02_08855 [Microbacterium paludicola]
MRIEARRPAIAVAVAAALVLGLTACVPEPSAGEARRDPLPSFADVRTTQVDRDGDHWTASGVTIDVPADAVTANVANVAVGAPIGEADSGIALEVFGAPVRFESPASFADPVTVSWDVAGLPAEAAAAASLVRWDDRRRVWVPQPDAPTVADGALTAELTDTGIVTWATVALDETPAELAEATPPTCTDAALPDWLATATDPDRARPEATIATCVEGHQSDVLTVKTRSQDGVTRALELDGDAEFAWKTRSDTAGGDRFWRIAAGLVDGPGTALLPPRTGVDVGLAAPTDPAVPYRAVAGVDPRTATVDLLAAFTRRVSFGDVPDPSVTALVSTLYACGSAGADDVSDATDVADIGRALTGCVAHPESALATRLSEAAGGSAEATEVQGARAVASAMRIAAGGAFDALAASAAEGLVAAAATPAGGGSWTVLAARDAPAPGSWRPTCDDAEADATALFAELALQPAYASGSRELASDPRWRTAAAASVKPLADCTPEERARFAAILPDEWADPAAARVVVDEIAGLGLAMLSCDDLFALAQPLAAGFHPLRGIAAPGTGRVACGWAAEKGKAADDATVKSRVQVWVSREVADADEVARRRVEAGKAELGGVQDSPALDAAGGFAVGAYVPSGVELESWLPGYRIVITAASADDPTQWQLPEGLATVENIAEALTAG